MVGFTMAEAQFSGFDPYAFNRGVDSGTSLMERGQSMRLRKERAQQEAAIEQRAAEENERRRAQYQALLPVAHAKMQADLVSAQASVSNHTQMQKLRETGAAASATANLDFLEATSLADWDEQSRALSKLQVKYSWMGNVRDDEGQPIFKGFLSAVDEARANAVIRGRTDRELEARQQYGETISQARSADTVTRAGATVAAAEVRASAPTRLQRALRNKQEALDAGDDESASFYQSEATRLSAIPGNSAEGEEQYQTKLEAAQARLADATENGTQEEIAHWKNRVKMWTDTLNARKGRGKAAGSGSAAIDEALGLTAEETNPPASSSLSVPNVPPTIKF